MEQKHLVWIGTVAGSYLGSLVPLLWGAGQFSMSSIIFSGIGAIVGIYVGFKLGQ